MKWLLALITVLGISLYAEEANPVKPKPVLQIRPLFQGWSVDSTNGSQTAFSEFSTVLFANYPLGEKISMSLRAAQALTAGELADISGITDIQLMSNLYVEELSTVFSLNVNIPSGKKQFSSSELSTSSILGEYIFRFQVPNFGQGWNIAPGFVWAHPIREGWVAGLGGTYQYRGRYTPLQNLPSLNAVSGFDPGDELLLTAGFDVNLNSSSTFSTDLIWTTYGTDRWGDLELFDAGNRTSVVLLYQKFFRKDQFSAMFRFRGQGKNDVLIPVDTNRTKASQLSRTVPNSFQLTAGYRLSHSKSLAVNFSGEGRYYEDIGRIYSGGILLGLALQPQLIVNDNVVLPVHLKYIYGNFIENTTLSGVEIGIGIEMRY